MRKQLIQMIAYIAGVYCWFYADIGGVVRRACNVLAAIQVIDEIYGVDGTDGWWTWTKCVKFITWK